MRRSAKSPGGAVGVVLLAAAVWLGLSVSALAKDLLTVTVSVAGGPSATSTFPDADALINAIDSAGYKSINPAYTVTSAATIDVNFRGVTANVIYPAGGATLDFFIPEIQTAPLFTGTAGTRAANERALETFLRTNQSRLLSLLLQRAVKATPHDPVAGTPGSLMARMTEADFIMGTTIGPDPSSVATTGQGYDRTRSTIGLNARFGHFTAAGAQADVIDLPLNYTVPLDDPRYAISFDLPLTYVETEGKASYSGSFGIGVRLPLYDNWTLTPAIRAGLVGSVDLGSAAVLGSVSLNSNYRFSYSGLDFSLGNSVAYIQTFPVEIDGTKFDYDQRNLVLRNGLGVSGPTGFKLFGQDTTWQVTVVNTQFLIDPVYARDVTDIAFSVGTVNSINGFTWDSVRIGLTYSFSTDSDLQGLRLNFGYRF